MARKKLTTPRIFAIGSAVVGLAVVVIGVVLGWVVVPDIIENKVKEETQLIPESDTYEKWTDLPVPIHLKVWFFSVTNLEDFENDEDWSKMPKFEEVGPYAFKENRSKYAIRDGPDDTLYYRQNITYTFDKEMSGEGLEETDIVTVLNLPLVAALTILSVNPKLHPLGYLTLKSLLTQKEYLFKNFTVREVLFSGTELGPVYGTIELVARLNGIPLPDEIKNRQFAYYRGKNATNGEGEWRVHKGVADYRKFAVIKSVSDGKESLEPWWKDEYSNMINGTDGTMFPPFVEESTRLFIYVPEICRSIFMDYDSRTNYQGIPGYRFKIPKELFTDPAVYPPNEGFCMPMPKPLNSSCNFNGLGRLFSCKADVPITIGKPHFLDADPWIVAEAIKYGLSPRKEIHDTYLDIEPNTGFPLRVHKRLQIGAELQPIWDFNVTKPWGSIPHTIYPVFWADEAAELDKPLVDEIKSKLITPLNLVKIGKWSMIGVGSFLLIAGAGFFAYSWFR